MHLRTAPSLSLRTRMLATYAACALLVAACDAPASPTAGAQSAPPNLHRYVTGAAAASLNENGLFSIDPPSSPGGRPIISAQRAGELALAFVHTWGGSLRGAWERESGKTIDPSALVVGPRIFFARTPYGAFPDGYHPAFARTFGPYYLVPLYSGPEPVLLISVSAYNEAVSIDPRGLVRRPIEHGMEFISMGLPADTSTFRLVSPEEAVEMVGRATGARVTRSPELVRAAMPQAPAASLWKLTLDREVPVQARGAVRRVRDIYVGSERGRRLLIARPSTARTHRVAALTAGGAERIEHVEVPILDSETIALETVDVQPQGADQ